MVNRQAPAYRTDLIIFTRNEFCPAAVAQPSALGPHGADMIIRTAL